MIIVSQDKDNVVNFDNVIGIRTATDKENNKERLIAIDTMNGEIYYFAKYATEERAKEVLESITAAYQENKLLECTSGSKEQNQMADRFLEAGIKPFKYEMPGE